MDSKPFYQSRTILLAVAMVFLAALADPQISSVIPLAALPYITAVGALLAIVVRFVTNTAVHVPGWEPPALGPPPTGAP